MRRRSARPSSTAPVLIALVAGLTGFALRGFVSSPEPSAQAPVVTVLACPDTSTPREEAPRVTRPTRPATTPTTPLPPLAPVDEAREALLAFVRERSSGLADCAGSRRERLRLTVRLDVSEAGVVEKVSVLEDEPALAPVRTCVERGIASWTLPTQWLSGQRTLLVSIVL